MFLGLLCLKFVVIHTSCLAGCVMTQRIRLFSLSQRPLLAAFSVLHLEVVHPICLPGLRTTSGIYLFVCLHSPHRQLLLFRRLVWSLLEPAGPRYVYLLTARLLRFVCLSVLWAVVIITQPVVFFRACNCTSCHNLGLDLRSQGVNVLIVTT